MPAVVEQPVIQHILGKEPVVPELEIDVLFKNTLGGVLKMLYAMIWQVTLFIQIIMLQKGS